jgi:hypothetical protein
MWDHIQYKDVTPPSTIAIVRDVCAVFLFLSLLVLVGVTSVILAKRCMTYDPLVPPTQQEVWALRITVVLALLYTASGFYWAGTYGYYTLGHHAMPAVVNVFRWISMLYFIIVSVILITILLSQAPPEVTCLLCLMLN